ncbi:MAG: FAD binding domain-containing protein [Armatimonadetes bacterium]|nr:FAD binding domain-containing protein [Armatimonadota bacterium]
MNNFAWLEPKSVDEAAEALKQGGIALAGGIDLLTVLKERLVEPQQVVNLKSLPGMRSLEGRNGLRIGALVTLDRIAADEELGRNFAAVAQAAASVGSPQIRNVGTLGGNLCQRPRCWYFRDAEVHCLKKGGAACYAVAGNNEYHAIFGGGPCHIVHPSDVAPALIAFDAEVITNRRRMPLQEFFVLPSENVRAENVLEIGEIVTGVEAGMRPGTFSAYVKMQERPSFDWALSGCAVVLQMNGGRVQDARIVLSGVAPIPWRSREAEAAVKGRAISEVTADDAGQAAVRAAQPMTDNRFKVKLTANAVKIALLKAAGQRV